MSELLTQQSHGAPPSKQRTTRLEEGLSLGLEVVCEPLLEVEVLATSSQGGEVQHKRQVLVLQGCREGLQARDGSRWESMAVNGSEWRSVTVISTA